jgi:hypothetical protein
MVDHVHHLERYVSSLHHLLFVKPDEAYDTSCSDDLDSCSWNLLALAHLARDRLYLAPHPPVRVV